eukprot:gene42899-53226_t
MEALLTKGTADSIIQNQVAIMVQKRFKQFTRSNGQWALGLFCPLAMDIAACAIIRSMPDAIIGGAADLGVSTFDNMGFATVISGPESNNNALGAQEVSYAGQTYQEMFNYIDNIATTELGNTSTAGIYYESVSNFTVM